MLMDYASYYVLCLSLFLISAFILVPGYGTVFMSVHDHGAVFPFLYWCSSRPLRWSEGRGRDKVVSELMLQHGPEWTTKV